MHNIESQLLLCERGFHPGAYISIYSTYSTDGIEGALRIFIWQRTTVPTLLYTPPTSFDVSRQRRYISYVQYLIPELVADTIAKGPETKAKECRVLAVRSHLWHSILEHLKWQIACSCFESYQREKNFQVVLWLLTPCWHRLDLVRPGNQRANCFRAEPNRSWTCRPTLLSRLSRLPSFPVWVTTTVTSYMIQKQGKLLQLILLAKKPTRKSWRKEVGSWLTF